MARMQSDHKAVEVLAAALLAVEGDRNKDIAIKLGIEPVTVTRHLAKARRDYLKEDPRILFRKLPRNLVEKARLRLTNQKLQDQLNKMAKAHGQDHEVSLRVFHCGRCRDDQKRVRKLAEAAAPHVRALLRRSKSCGLTWGGTLECLVAALRDLPHPKPWKKAGIQFIPLSGEPLARERSSFSSSSLARELGIIVNGEQYDAPTLAMVPAFIPDNFGKYEKIGVRRLIELVKSYHDIFSPHQNGNGAPREERRTTPSALGLDMILTSVGSLDKPLGFGRGVLFDEMSVTYNELKSLIVAEVGGVCIPRPNLSRAQLDQLDKVQISWTGLTLKHLEACARRGTDPLKGPPGVVVVSGGKKRAAVTCELIKRGLVNHLIIDDVLARELTEVSRPKRQG